MQIVVSLFYLLLKELAVSIWLDFFFMSLFFVGFSEAGKNKYVTNQPAI